MLWEELTSCRKYGGIGLEITQICNLGDNQTFLLRLFLKFYLMSSCYRVCK